MGRERRLSQYDKDILYDILTFLDQRADVSDGVPNDAMRLYSHLSRMLDKLEGLEDA